MSKILKNCCICNKEFSCYVSNGKREQYTCSNTCKLLRLSKKPRSKPKKRNLISCKICGKEFLFTKNAKEKTCSIKCRAIFQTHDKIFKKCHRENCDNIFEIKNSYKEQKYCSNKCSSMISSLGRNKNQQSRDKVKKSIIEKYKIDGPRFDINNHNMKGRGKSGYYKGFWCDSRWELALVIYCELKNISINRNKQSFKYLHPKSNTERKFFPDFRIEGTLIEVKGYEDPEILNAKIFAVNEEIHVFKKEELRDIFLFVSKNTKTPMKKLHILYDKSNGIEK